MWSNSWFYYCNYEKMNWKRNIVLAEEFRHSAAAASVLAGLTGWTETLQEERACPSETCSMCRRWGQWPRPQPLSSSVCTSTESHHFCRTLAELLCSQGEPDKQTDGISCLRPWPSPGLVHNWLLIPPLLMFDCLLPEVLPVPAAAVSSQSGVWLSSLLLCSHFNWTFPPMMKSWTSQSFIYSCCRARRIFFIRLGNNMKGKIINFNGGKHTLR